MSRQAGATSDPYEPAAHMLVVDDDREIRDFFSRFLRKYGCRVDVAAGTEMKRRMLDAALIEIRKFGNRYYGIGLGDRKIASLTQRKA